MKCILTGLDSVIGRVNVTVFVDIPLPGLEHDIEVDLRNCAIGWLHTLTGVLD